MTRGDVHLLRIYVTAVERRGGKLLYELIVRTARGLDLAGASVFPVQMSFGTSRHVHDASSDYGFAELPVVIEIVEARQRIEALLTALGDSLASSLLTIEPVRIYSHVCEANL
jgi:PII-like signaling protein